MESGDVPDETKYAEFQKIINEHKQKGSIFIHCKSGIDRTGVMSAMYQMKNNIKDKKQAYETMKDCGYNIFHQMKYGIIWDISNFGEIRQEQMEYSRIQTFIRMI